MSAPAAIRFDTPTRVDRVTLAVLPIDGFTGALVTRGVQARVLGLSDRPIVNGSGMLVFINLPDPPAPPAYRVEVDAREGGFFGPELLPFTPPPAGDPDEEAKRRLPLLLKPKPDYVYPSGTTLVRGVVVRANEPVAGAVISSRPPSSAARFEALSDDRGAFALALRPHPDADLSSLDIRFEQGGDVRTLAGKALTRGRSHSFLEPIDLSGTNDPKFFTI